MPPTSAPATASSSLSGYRLSGADLDAWSGKRVQIVGTVAPMAAATAATATSPGTPAMPEFRVQSVQAATGSCPPQ
jgi:hypothetical protein